MSDFDFVTYKERDFRYHYAMEREYASCPRSRGSNIVINDWRKEEQRLFLAWDKEVKRRQKAGQPFSEAIMYRDHYQEMMLSWPGSV